MNASEFLEKFRDQFDETDPESIELSTVYKDLDEWSSLSVIMVIAFFDEEFGKEIDNIAVRKAETIQDLYDLATAE